jgi:diguanylate cyclase (GGDEF)-like protein
MAKIVSTQKELNDFWHKSDHKNGVVRRFSWTFTWPRWLDLRFPAPLEQSFSRQRNLEAVSGARVALAFLGIVLVLGALLDAVLSDGTAQQIWAVRLPCLTVLLGLFLLSYTGPFSHMLPLAMWVMIACAAATFLSYSALWTNELRFFYAAGLAPMVLMTVILCQATLISTTLLMILVFAGANIYWFARFGGDADQGQWLVSACLYLLVMISGGLCLHRWEQWRRRQFLMHQKQELSKFSASELEHESEKLRFLVALDAELGIANRRSFERALRQEWRRAIRNQYPIAMLLVEVLDLESDSKTAPIGPLREVAQIAGTFARRPGDLIGRYGDATLAVLLVDTDRENALLVGRRLQDHVAQLVLKKKIAPTCGACAGLSSLLPAPAVFPHDLISNANAALVRSISAGIGAVVDN